MISGVGTGSVVAGVSGTVFSLLDGAVCCEELDDAPPVEELPAGTDEDADDEDADDELAADETTLDDARLDDGTELDEGASLDDSVSSEELTITGGFLLVGILPLAGLSSFITCLCVST